MSRRKQRDITRLRTNNFTLAEKLDHWSMPEPNSGCILWIGTTARGYGRISIGGRGQPVVSAHRLAWQLANGPIPAGMLICHKCDVRACINPAHLFLGTQGDNIADQMAKGRHFAMRGEQHPQARLTSADVESIRRDDRSQREIAEHFGISQTTVYQIQRRESWRHVP